MGRCLKGVKKLYKGQNVFVSPFIEEPYGGKEVQVIGTIKNEVIVQFPEGSSGRFSKCLLFQLIEEA